MGVPFNDCKVIHAHGLVLPFGLVLDGLENHEYSRTANGDRHENLKAPPLPHL